ncbi:MAG: hypothetical protein RR942_16920 [Romboutsia sp.]
MNKHLDIVTSLTINLMLFVTWVVKTIFTADTPILFKDREILGIVIALCVLTLIYIVYIIKTKYVIFNLIQISLILILWKVCFNLSRTYNYHEGDTFVNKLGFALTLLIFVLLIIKAIFKSLKFCKNKLNNQQI